MTKSVKRIGVLTGGGDAPGLNAVIRAVVKSATNEGIECVGLEDSFDGLIYPEMSRPLTSMPPVTGRRPMGVSTASARPSSRSTIHASTRLFSP